MRDAPCLTLCRLGQYNPLITTSETRPFRALIVFLWATSATLSAQSTSGPLPSFDLISVKPNNTAEQFRSNVPLGPGDAYNPTGGHFIATNWPLITYILFAYRIVGDQAQSLPSQLPGWVSTEHFDIEARTDGDPAKDTKNQMRLMMRSLLADRFGLVTHREMKQAPVFGLTLSTQGKTGPQLQPHDDASACSTTFSRSEDSPAKKTPQDDKFPLVCGAFLGMLPTTANDTRVGARNVTMAFIASGLSEFGNLGRPVVDQTGLAGAFDMSLEWFPDQDTPQPDFAGPNFLDAIKKQLGLKLDSQRGSTEVLIVDHIERPSKN